MLCDWCGEACSGQGHDRKKCTGASRDEAGDTCFHCYKPRNSKSFQRPTKKHMHKPDQCKACPRKVRIKLRLVEKGHLVLWRSDENGIVVWRPWHHCKRYREKGWKAWKDRLPRTSEPRRPRRLSNAIPALIKNPANPNGPPIHDPDTGNDTHLLCPKGRVLITQRYGSAKLEWLQPTQADGHTDMVLPNSYASVRSKDATYPQIVSSLKRLREAAKEREEAEGQEDEGEQPVNAVASKEPTEKASDSKKACLMTQQTSSE